jgi:hypothetical protein
VIKLHRINKSSRLVVVDGLREGAMQEHIFHIKLMNGLGVGNGQGEHHAYHGWLDHQAEGLIVVNTESLGQTTKDPASLVPFQRAVEVELLLEDPFAGDDIGANGSKDKITGVVGDQRSKFFFHGTVLVQIDEGGADGGGHQ